MCSCEPGWVCARCAGTPFDPNYFTDDPPAIGVDEFETMTTTGHSVEPVWLYDPSIR